MKKIFALILVVAMLSISCAFAENAALAHDDVVVMYTNDVHCGVSDNIGYAGLAAYKKAYEKAGNDVVLVDCGDFAQGGSIGALSKGSFILEIMNKIGYDVATLGNHEFDYGIDRFFELVDEADFPIVSANFCDMEGTPLLAPYKIVEAGGWKIAFVGVSTPETYTASSPKSFMDDDGNYKYQFCEGNDGKDLYAAAQTAVDNARAEGADIVIALCHLGIAAESAPFTSSDLILNTTGIDVVLDGHSHSVLEGEWVKNLNGEEVILSSTGTKLNNVGTLTIGFDEEANAPTFETELHSESIFQDDEIAELIDGINAELDVIVNEVVAHSDVDLIINDPESGARIVRQAETNLGDLIADAYRVIMEADIGIVNGGSIRAEIRTGDVTYGNLIEAVPYGNSACVVKANGQQILDALEMGARKLPDANAGFLQVSGLTYEIDTTIPSSVVTNEKGGFVEVAGERRVKNVMVAGNPIDPEGEYTLACTDYLLKEGGDGFNMFMDDPLLKDCTIIDNELLIQYVTESLGGEIDESYADPFGQDRIVILQ